jgi:tripartite-type tricarboxylate transporter receptor subunit TctC
MYKHTRITRIAIAATLMIAATGHVLADDYPTKPVHLVVPFPAGGATDVIARMAAQFVSEKWGKPVIVENKGGATGAIAGEYVMRAPADGYTLLVATASTHAVLPAYRPNLGYDTVKDFAPATLLATFPNLLVVNPQKIPSKTVGEFIDYLKAHPGKVSFGSSGAGGSVHFSGELFKLMTHTQMLHVPYRGSAPALTDLLGGTVDVMFDNLASVWPQVQRGALRALGVASLKPSELAPGVPTIAETVPGYEALSWVGVVAPGGTPKPIVDKIAAAFGEAMKSPVLIERLKTIGATAATDSPEEFKSFIAADRTKWQDLAKKAHLAAP